MYGCKKNFEQKDEVYSYSHINRLGILKCNIYGRSFDCKMSMFNNNNDKKKKR